MAKSPSLSIPRHLQLLPTTNEEAERTGDDSELVTKYGWVVSSNPLGQLIMSPILGYISNRMNGRIGPVCMFTRYIILHTELGTYSRIHRDCAARENQDFSTLYRPPCCPA